MNEQLSLFNSEVEKVQPPLRYPGSKFRASKHIMPYIKEVNHTEYREPFFGGGAIFFVKNKADINWINDIDSQLITTYQVISDINKCEELLNRLEDIKIDKESFNQLRDWEPKSEIDIAFKYFVINRTSYSGIMNKPNFGFHPTKSVQPHKWPERIKKASEKLRNTQITNLHFRDIITEPSNNEVLLFLDPPYYKADQKRAYRHSFLEKDHQELLELLKCTNFKFCLTYDDCPEIRELYSWANINQKEWMYHTANSNNTTRKKGSELIITNY